MDELSVHRTGYYGEVTITLAKDKPLIYLTYRLTATGNYYAKYVRGPWLKVGEASLRNKKG